MGYTTEFKGFWELSKDSQKCTLTQKQSEYLNLFSNTRRMERNPEALWKKYKGQHGNGFFDGELIKENINKIYGAWGEYFAFDDNNHGQNGFLADDTIIDYNSPGNAPGLWCQWIVDGNKILWDGNEKFYSYVEWIEFIIKNFLEHNNYFLNGTVRWKGEEFDDTGKIIINNNIITVIS